MNTVSWRMQMRTLGALAVLVLLLMTHCLVLTYAASNADRESLQKTGEAIRTAFAQGDVDRIMAYHHPAPRSNRSTQLSLISGRSRCRCRRSSQNTSTIQARIRREPSREPSNPRRYGHRTDCIRDQGHTQEWWRVLVV